MANKPRGLHAINISSGRTSHILLKRKGPNFPSVADPANPGLGEILGASVVDDDNGIYFSATVVGQPGSGGDRKRLALRLVSALPFGGGDPLDGLLTITLQVVTSLFPLTTTPVEVADTPVDYISDPSAP